ncbi:MAG: hypothetical protein V4736_06685 [Bdellovibrionota bacterium]
MKTVLSVLVLGLIGQAALAKQVSIDCRPPVGLAGNAATIKGKLNISNGTTDDGYHVASGKLAILVGGSTAKPVYVNKAVAIQGVILIDNAINAAPVKEGPLTIVYLNPTRKDLSYVEVDGQMYPSNCVK